MPSSIHASALTKEINNQSMRVLHFFKTYWPDTFGGIERTIDAIATGTARHGIETDVLSLSKTPEQNSVVFNGYHAYKAKQNFEFASTGFSRDAFSKFSSLAAKADIIHYHFPWPFMDIVHFASRIQKPSLVTYHSDIVKQNGLLKLYRPLMRRFLRSVDRIVVTSSNYLDTSEQLSDFKDKTTVIPIGLARSSYPPVDDTVRDQWRERLPDRFFLFIGVLRYYKGLHILLNAAKLAPYPIVIVGGGPTEQDLKTQAVQLGLTNIHFLGPVQDDDKVALLDLCSAVVFPSHLRSEAFGLALVEASMFAKPMISCEIGTGTSFVNLDGVTGLIVPPDDAPALSKALTRLWDNPDLAARYGQAALARYEQHFTATRMADAYATLYQKLLQPSRP